MNPDIPVISVSQLNRQIRLYLENQVGVIHVEGEISNMSRPVSGHCYFTLKDPFAQIRCVFFKNRHLSDSKNILIDGRKIMASGKLSLYEARGDYQLIIDSVTDAGLGDLHQQFEKLKKKLSEQGLFDPARKKTLPVFPFKIGVITSSTGAALRDILTTLARRFPLAHVLVFPSEVQGMTATQSLINAIELAEKDARSEVLILARGGGSLEDLWAFNMESLALKIASCPIPIITGIGHETDFTIADFVADYRAATPTAAAETVTPDFLDLIAHFSHIETRLNICMMKYIEHQALKLTHLSEKIASPKTIIMTHAQTLDYIHYQLKACMEKYVRQKYQYLHSLQLILQKENPANRIAQAKEKIEQIPKLLTSQIQYLLQEKRKQFSTLLSTLHAVSPLATLERGYAIVSRKKQVLYSIEEIEPGESINVRLRDGQLHCEILSKSE